MALKTTVLPLALLMLSLRAAAMTALPECDDFRLEMREENIVLFVEGKDDNPLLEEHKCLGSAEGVVSYYTCKTGYRSVLKNIDDPEILGNPEIIFNINELKSLPGNDEEDYVVDCLPEETEESQNEEESQAREEIDELPSTPVPSTVPAKTTPQPLPLCSEITGTNRRRNFRYESRSRVCKLRCRFPVSVYGMSAGFRSGRLYTCCEGEPQRLGTGRYAPYICPTSEEDQEETKPEVKTQDEKEVQESEEDSSIEISASKVTTSSTSADSAPTTVVAAASSDEVSSSPVSSSVLTKTTPPPLPLCSEVTGVNRRNDFRPDSRDRVCEFRCRFPVSVYGISAGFRSRRLYTCCEGEPEQRGTGRYAPYICPQ